MEQENYSNPGNRKVFSFPVTLLSIGYIDRREEGYQEI